MPRARKYPQDRPRRHAERADSRRRITQAIAQRYPLVLRDAEIRAANLTGDRRFPLFRCWRTPQTGDTHVDLGATRLAGMHKLPNRPIRARNGALVSRSQLRTRSHRSRERFPSVPRLRDSLKGDFPPQAPQRQAGGRPRPVQGTAENTPDHTSSGQSRPARLPGSAARQAQLTQAGADG